MCHVIMLILGAAWPSTRRRGVFRLHPRGDARRMQSRNEAPDLYIRRFNTNEWGPPQHERSICSICGKCGRMARSGPQAESSYHALLWCHNHRVSHHEDLRRQAPFRAPRSWHEEFRHVGTLSATPARHRRPERNQYH